MQHMPITISDP